MRRQGVIFRLVLLGLFFCGILVGGLIAVYFLAMPLRNPTIAQAIPTAAPTPQLPADSVYAPLDAMDQVMNALYERVSPSVVHITSQTQTVDQFYGVVPSEGTGSGFVWDTSGHIVTNNHVVAGATQVTVLLANGASLDANVVGTDEYYDLAVLHIDVTANEITPLELGDSTQLKVGQRVVAIGNPFGLDRTMTSGLVSALGRTVQTGNNSVIGQAIQTDAAINPGNSGGPLLDLRGRVIGIDAAINSPSGGSVGIGFAVPISVVERVVPVLISQGHFAHPTLGITTADLGTQVSPAQGGPQKGLLVLQVASGGPAAQAGIQPAQVSRRGYRQSFNGGDIITAVDGQTVNAETDLQVALETNHKPGDTVTLTVWRNGQSLSVKVTLGQQ